MTPAEDAPEPATEQPDPARQQPDPARQQYEYHYVLRCPCGETLTGDTEDDIVDISFDHLRAKHPDMAETYEREHILFMALRLRK